MNDIYIPWWLGVWGWMVVAVWLIAFTVKLIHLTFFDKNFEGPDIDV